MKKDTTHTRHQEIFLVTSTTFFQKQLCERIDSESHHTSHLQRLEVACWNGLLDEWFPEIIKRSTNGKNLCVAHIESARPFLKIELSVSISFFNNSFSIDPHRFLPQLRFAN